MSEEFTNFDPDPEFDVSEPIEKEKRGSVMLELESWERVIDGMKMAADGARHMARYGLADKWNHFASYLDQIRRAVIRDGGFDRPADAKDSVIQYGGEGIPMVAACRRIAEGLKMAAAGADQIANCQRLDMRWVIYAQRFRTLADIEHKLAMKTSQMVTEQGWRNNRTGILIPERLH
jgi:hypothetical protein